MSLLRRLLVIAIGVVVTVSGAAVSLGVVFLEDVSRVPEMTAPSPEDVVAVREFVRKVRQATQGDRTEQDSVTLPLDDLKGALRMGLRFLPGIRADAVLQGHTVHISVSLPVPWLGSQKWLNVSAVIPQFEGQVSLQSLEVGGHKVPPDLSLRFAQVVANSMLGNRAGDLIAHSASRMRIEGQAMVFTLRLDRSGRERITEGAFKMLRDDAMPSPESIDRYYRKIRTAMDEGALPTSGSFLPYLRFALERALEDDSEESLPNAYTASLMALTKACGAKEIANLVGRLTTDSGDRTDYWRTDCNKLTLADRIDTRQHFTTAAAIEAASNRGLAVSIGEFKELHDAITGGSGFDFTDIVANNSGIRFSDLFMSRTRADWPALIEKIKSEYDILPDFTGVPQTIPGEKFSTKFGDVNSTAYREMISLIESRIDRLPLHSNRAAQ